MATLLVQGLLLAAKQEDFRKSKSHGAIAVFNLYTTYNYVVLATKRGLINLQHSLGERCTQTTTIIPSVDFNGAGFHGAR